MNTLYFKGIPKPVFRLFFSLLFLLPFTVAAFAQSSPVDPTFAPNFIVAGGVRQVVVQPDGKLLVAGFFKQVNGATAQSGLVRLNPDGSLDPGFQIPQTISFQSIFLLSDGKILFAGGAFPNAPIGRLNADGTPDPTFTPNPSSTVSVSIFAVQPNGKILLGGGARAFPGDPTLGLPLNRLNADGSPDTGFTAPFQRADIVQSIAVSGSRIIASTTNELEGLVSRISGRNDNGTPDGGFNAPLVTLAPATPGTVTLTALPDGKVLLTGFFTAVGGAPRNGIARLNADGSLDQTFNPGTGVTGTIAAALPLPDGKFVLGGLFTAYNGITRINIARINADGSLDESFNPAGGANWVVAALARLSDGRLFIGGTFSLYAGENRTGLLRTTEIGTPDDQFSVDLRQTGSTTRIAVQPDDKTIISGFFNIIDGLKQLNITRLNVDGTTDASFSPNVGVLGEIGALILQPDGKILVGGAFSVVNATPRLNLARLNSDGTLDPTLTPAFIDGRITALGVQTDGKILISGDFVTVAGVLRPSLARLNADGSFDPTFTPAPDALVGGRNQITVQPDGRILFGNERRGVLRLNPDGTLDSSFEFSVIFNYFGEFILQSDGRILTSEAAGDRSRIIRLNADGSRDSTFPSPLIPGTTVHLRKSPNDKVVVASIFNNPGPGGAGFFFRTYIARLNADGTFDSTFSTSLGATGSIRDIGIQSDRRILLAGDWLSVGGTVFSPFNPLVRLNAETSSCGFTVSPSSFTYSQAGGRGTLNITTGDDCIWTVENVPTWITGIPRIDTNNRTIQFQIRPNTGAARNATFTVAGQTITITQAATGSGSAGAFRPSTGFVFLRNTNDTGVADTQFFYGQASDVPVVGDWDGNGTDTVGIYRNGTFFLRNSNSSGFADIQFPFGQPGDIPIAGDWDGDGIDTVGIIRGSEVFLRNSNTAGDAQIQFFYGQAGDIYLAGDWNGDGIDTIGAYRPSTGFVYLRNSNTSGFADIEFFYGTAGDKPVVGDWNHDGVDTIGVVRGNRWLLRNSNTAGFADIEFNYGLDSDIPLAGDWNGLP